PFPLHAESTLETDVAEALNANSDSEGQSRGGRKPDCATGIGAGIDGVLDRGRIVGRAVPFGSPGEDVIPGIGAGECGAGGIDDAARADRGGAGPSEGGVVNPKDGVDDAGQARGESIDAGGDNDRAPA